MNPAEIAGHVDERFRLLTGDPGYPSPSCGPDILGRANRCLLLLARSRAGAEGAYVAMAVSRRAAIEARLRCLVERVRRLPVSPFASGRQNLRLGAGVDEPEALCRCRGAASSGHPEF